ncbi:C-glycoside deglycosidase beta subunit domain-containing protein [Demequina lignilytica]|uniref:C-glycoside deglycosidase beta subunit domain-containing protein n=1 Tax=Demequina lignilytica TaxID=3051663 RepID=UPI00345CEE6C
MLDINPIQSRGFANTLVDGAAVGFQLDLRNPNYRGLSASLVDGVDVTVDGHLFPHEGNVYVLEGRELTLAELRRTTSGRWDLDRTMTVKVPLAGGLERGVHRVAVDVRLRAPYIPIEFQPNVFHFEREAILIGAVSEPRFKYGVSTYSYTGDMNTVMTLEDAMAHVADLGATGFEILGEGNVAGYPDPTTEWIDRWFAGLERYGLKPTNFGSWIDSRMWLDRDLTVDEGAAALERDIRLAARLGFSFVRPKIGVVSLDLVPHPIWDEAVERNLELAQEKGIVICPEIHSPTPIKHKVVDDYLAFIERTGTRNFGLLIDTGIFMTRTAFQGMDGKEPENEDDVPVPLRPLHVPASDLAEVLEHVVFIQAKFYEVDDDLVDVHIPWEPVLQVLRDGGYEGYLSSEYEGPRIPYRGIEQVRRQHAMFHKLEQQL